MAFDQVISLLCSRFHSHPVTGVGYCHSRFDTIALMNTSCLASQWCNIQGPQLRKTVDDDFTSVAFIALSVTKGYPGGRKIPAQFQLDFSFHVF